MEKLRDELNQILANASGQPIEQIQRIPGFLRLLRKDYGLADSIRLI